MDINEALRKFTYGVYVIGVPGPEYPNFMTAAWVMRVAEEPPLVAVAVANVHYTCELLLEEEKKQGVFGISVLGRSKGREIATACGTVSGRERAKLTPEQYQITKSGAPVVKDSIVYMACRLQKTITLGDHTLFIGEVICAHEGDMPKDIPLSRREGVYV